MSTVKLNHFVEEPKYQINLLKIYPYSENYFELPQEDTKELRTDLLRKIKSRIISNI